MQYDIRKGNMKLSDHFKLSEFQCKDMSPIILVDEKLIKRLECLRCKIGKPIIINSAYRTPTYNKKIGGANESQHLIGTAVDITVAGMTPSEVAKVADQVGFTGIGLYDTFTHVDVRPKVSRWDERTRK